MKTVVEYLKKLAMSGYDIIDEEKLMKLIWYLVNSYNLSSYVKNVKAEYFPIKPDEKIIYNIQKSRIEYFMWPLIKESEKLSELPLNEYEKRLYISINALIHVRYVIELIIDIYIKSKRSDNFESYLLHTVLEVYKRYLSGSIDERDSNALYKYEKICNRDFNISPLERLANHYAYQDVLNHLSGEDAVRELICETYDTFMKKAYDITDTPTMDYLKDMRNNGLINDIDQEYLSNLAALEPDHYKYGLILPK